MEDRKMIYLDSNVIVLASLNRQVKGEEARKLIRSIREGKTQACTSYLTWDEVFWTVSKYRDYDKGLEAGRALLELANLYLLPVDRTIVSAADNLMEKYQLKPRDAIHAASAIKNDAEILSEDRDFDKIDGLTRRSL